MRRIGILLLISLIFIISAVGVHAQQPTRINVTMTETVNRNVTYAENFYLEERTSFCTIEGVLTVANPDGPEAETISEIYVHLGNIKNLMTNLTLLNGRTGMMADYNISATENSDTYYILLIPELRPGENSTWSYNISCGNVNPPLDIQTNYTNPTHGTDRKVLADNYWVINQSATNSLSINEQITNVNVNMDVAAVNWEGALYNFSFGELYPYGNFSDVSNNGTSNSTWVWTPGSGTLAQGETVHVVYSVRAPAQVPTSATYKAIVETLTYQVPYLASNISIDNITGVSRLETNLDKRIVRPADNENTTNVTWEVNADVRVPANLNVTYTLKKVSVWVTGNLLPSNVSDTSHLNYSYINATGTEISANTSWQMAAWQFNYTDGSDPVSSRPPIVWIRPFFQITDGYNQILNSTFTQSGNDYYMKYIYVINGYWLQIDKNITSIAQDRYKINVRVENIGNAWTPKDLLVTVYDFVPSEFTAWNYSQAASASSTVTGTEYNGTAYRWTVPQKLPQNASLGPKGQTGEVNSSWSLTYDVNGTGAYAVSELYIVGLDPRKVEGAGAHEGITVISAFTSYTAEVFYVGVVLFLVVLNVVNFLMTKKINDKLDSHNKK